MVIQPTLLVIALTFLSRADVYGKGCKAIRIFCWTAGRQLMVTTLRTRQPLIFKRVQTHNHIYSTFMPQERVAELAQVFIRPSQSNCVLTFQKSYYLRTSSRKPRDQLSDQSPYSNGTSSFAHLEWRKANFCLYVLAFVK